jgi:hypothetical protein
MWMLESVCLSAGMDWMAVRRENFETYESLTIAIHISCVSRSTFLFCHILIHTFTMTPIPAPNEKRDTSPERKPQKKKRKSGGKHDQTTNSLEKGEDDSRGSNNKRQRGNPLNGMTVAVSTLEEKGKSKSEAGTTTSFKEVAQTCRDLGADVSNQICKRVHVLICTRSAVEYATQRVRKAFKKNIPLVDTAWVQKCQLERARVDFEPYRLEKQATESIHNYNKANAKSGDKKKRSSTDDNMDKEEDEELPDRGWSEPADLGCCCVCHEQGTAEDCEWCVDCKA